VGTAKRERQKANRQAKLERIVSEEKKQKVKRTGLRFGIGIPLAIAAVVLIAWIFRDDKDKGETQSTAPVTTPTSADPGTTIAPDPSATTVAPTVPTPVAFAYGTGECPAADGSAPQKQEFTEAFKLCIDPAKTYTATFDTNKGKLTVALEAKAYPGTVNNFVSLARNKYYDKTVCHRIIAGFVVQCGRPGGPELEGRPGYTIAEEIPARAYKIGDLVMAKTASPNSTGGQIFIVTGDQGAALPPQYSIVGSITEGLDVAAAMEKAANPADDTAPLEKIEINSITITEA
jgi:cyclophilin family peptidyl-prolyl cis-trans isomerase